jgi:hypothetical protein
MCPIGGKIRLFFVNSSKIRWFRLVSHGEGHFPCV